MIILQAHEYMEKYLLEEWTQMENELLRERGLWGPPLGSWLDKWMLDMVEGPCRMRKKMVKNDMFYVHYPYRPDMEDSVSTVLSWSEKNPSYTTAIQLIS